MENENRKHVRNGHVVLHRIDEGYEAWVGERHFIIVATGVSPADMSHWTWTLWETEITPSHVIFNNVSMLGEIRDFLDALINPPTTLEHMDAMRGW